MAVVAAASIAPRFSIGKTIADSFRVIRLNFFTFALVALVTHLIWALAPTVSPSRAYAPRLDDLGDDILRTMMGLLVTCLTQLGLVFGTLRTLLGHRASVRDVWPGLRFIVPAFVAGGVAYAPFLAMSVAEVVFAGNPIAVGLVAIPVTFGGLFLVLIYWITSPVIAIEQATFRAALTRSRQLTKGCRWKIVAIWLLVGVMVLFTAVIVALATGQDIQELAASKPTTIPGAIWYAMVAIWGAFFATLTNVAYYRLRTEKEGIADEVAHIFD
jgi:hypothetical protein